jgi:hypothetical protein
MTHTRSMESKAGFGGIGNLATVTMVAALGMASCDGIWAKDAYTALQIKQAQVLKEGECTVPAEPTSLYQSAGILDIAVPDGSTRPYQLGLSIFNAMESAGIAPAEEMNNITLESFVVELAGDWYDSSGVPAAIPWDDVCPQKFEYPVGTVRLSPGGYAGTLIEPLREGHTYCLQRLSQLYQADITATIKAKGRHGGTSIVSAPFKYRIEACKGCLQTGYDEEQLATLNGALIQCETIESVNDKYRGGCYLGQDRMFLCCSTTSSNPAPSEVLCPAISTKKPDPVTTP